MTIRRPVGLKLNLPYGGRIGSIRPHHSTDVSRFLEEAAREKLDRMELERVIRDGAGSLKEKDYPHWRDQPSINEWVRAQRRTEAAP